MRKPTEIHRQTDNHGDEICLVQLTDCHILEDAQGELKGLNTRQSFETVFAAVQSTSIHWDLLLATGDLSQDESAESYGYLAAQLNQQDIPVAWIPGNHDDPRMMDAVFRGERILNSKHIIIGEWQIVLLDSSVRGEVHGRVSEIELEFMHHALQNYPRHHALICLHHPAIDCGCAWLDKKSLLESESFREEVIQHANVRGVLWGHVHQEAHFRRNGIDWMSTPSTCIQFKPDSTEFELDNLPPGYRILRLTRKGRIESEVIRVA